MAQFVCGRTGLELMLLDKEHKRQPLLLEMAGRASASRETTRDIKQSLEFNLALRSFSRRVLYANIKGDILVPWGTSALQPDSTHLWPSHRPPPGASVLDNSHVDGCRLWYEHQLDPDGNALSPDASARENAKWKEEHEMARALRETSWRTVCVDFELRIPIAHNRIVAVARSPLERWLNRPGVRAVGHMADTLLNATAQHDRAIGASSCTQALSLKESTSKCRQGYLEQDP